MIENAVLHTWIADCKRRGLNTQTVEEALVDLRCKEIEKLQKENAELREWVERLNRGLAERQREIARLTSENNILATYDEDIDPIADALADGFSLTPKWWTKLKGWLRGKNPR